MKRVKRQIGKPTIELLYGDCLEELKSIESGSIDMILTDPPYGTTKCKWDSVIPLEPMWEQLKRVIKPSGAIVMTASQPFTTMLIASNMKMFRYEWIWHKNKVTDIFRAKIAPLKAHENIIVFSTENNFYFNPIKEERSANSHTKGYQITTGKGIYAGANTSSKAVKKGELSHPKSVQQINCIHWADSEKTNHPTQKPVALMEYLIKTYTISKLATVLDFAMGSGTTGVACKNLGRGFIGIEKDKTYYDLAVNRLKEERRLKLFQ